MMKASKVLRALAVVVALASSACSGADSGGEVGTPGGGGAPGTGQTSSGAPGTGQTSSGGAVATSTLAADLAFLREEEKLARDVYLTLYDVWKLNPHKNIAASEQTHTDRVKATLATFGLEDPVKDDTVGRFVNVDLAKLYTDLVAQGKQSEVESLKVGAAIEDLDIRDIEAMKSRTTDAGVLSMVDALQCGSRNHLRTYVSQLTSRGASYAPQYIPKADFDAILAGGNEQCGR